MKHLSNAALWTLLFNLRRAEARDEEATRVYEKAINEHMRRVASLRGRWKHGNVTGVGMRRMARYFDKKHEVEDALREAEGARVETEGEALLSQIADLLLEGGDPMVEA